MGAVDSPDRGTSRGKKKPRVSIRIDMTPMVDVAFLLLIFFMVTTVFRLPQAMEINLPPESAGEAEVSERDLLYLRVDQADSLWYNIGFDNPQRMQWNELRGLLDERKAAAGDHLTIVAKIHRKAKYSNMVDLLDEFNIAKTTRFSVLKFDSVDDSLLTGKGTVLRES